MTSTLMRCLCNKEKILIRDAYLCCKLVMLNLHSRNGYTSLSSLGTSILMRKGENSHQVRHCELGVSNTSLSPALGGTQHRPRRAAHTDHPSRVGRDHFFLKGTWVPCYFLLESKGDTTAAGPGPCPEAAGAVSAAGLLSRPHRPCAISHSRLAPRADAASAVFLGTTYCC